MPICIKRSRLVHHRCLPLYALLSGRPPSCEQLLTGFSLPFLFAQQHRHVTAELIPQGLHRALLDGMRKAVCALQPQQKFLETQCSTSHSGRIPRGIRTKTHQHRDGRPSSLKQTLDTLWTCPSQDMKMQ
jgi:hypothetical protein